MRPALLLAIAASLAAAAAALGAPPSLQRIVLRPAQVGVGYRMSVIPGGNLVQGQVTLDLCSPSFPSEGLRVARLQVVYAKPGVTQELSNEVVRYRPGGAQQALREVTHAATHCPRGPIQTPVAGVSSATWRVTRITDPRLLPGYLAVRIHLTEVYKGKKVVTSGLGVYEVKGDVLSGVYTNGSSITAAQERLALHAAEQSVGNLREFA